MLVTVPLISIPAGTLFKKSFAPYQNTHTLNLEKSSIENLNKYVGKNLNIIQNENRIEVIQGSEIQYILEND